MGRSISDQHKGGSFTIPDGYYVVHVDLDAEEPNCIAAPRENVSGEPIQIPIPRSLAYYLTTHHNGSIAFRNMLQESAVKELQSKIKELFGL